MVISALNSFEIGQPAFAFAAAVWNASSSAPGILAVTSRWIFVIANPESSFSNRTAAVVLIYSGSKPAFVNCPDKAIEKQPA